MDGIEVRILVRPDRYKVLVGADVIDFPATALAELIDWLELHLPEYVADIEQASKHEI